MGKEQAREDTIFADFLTVMFLSKMLETNFKCPENLPEAKASESSQRRCQNWKFMVYLLCPSKIPFQNYFWA